MIYRPWELYSECSREHKNFLESISIHFNCMQLKQQTSIHNNISLLGVSMH